MEWPGKDPKDKTIFNRFFADDAIAKTAGLQLVAGRDFDLKKFITDSTAMLVNESAVKHMGLKDPVGQTLKDNGIDFHVVGVVKDFILTSPYQPIRANVYRRRQRMVQRNTYEAERSKTPRHKT